MSNISMSLLTTLTHHIASIYEFDQVFTYWFSTAGVVFKIRKFKVYNLHASQQVTLVIVVLVILMHCMIPSPCLDAVKIILSAIFVTCITVGFCIISGWFPLTYDRNGFKSKASMHLSIMGSF